MAREGEVGEKSFVGVFASTPQRSTMSRSLLCEEITPRKRCSLLTRIGNEDLDKLSVDVEVMKVSVGEDLEGRTCESNFKCFSEPDVQVLVVTDIIDSLFRLLTDFYDDDYLAFLEENGVDFPPFHNGGESLTYTNVLFELDKELAIQAGNTRHRDEGGVHLPMTKPLLNSEKPECRIEWLSEAASHAEEQFMRELSYRGIGLEERVSESYFLDLKAELRAYIAASSSLRAERTAVAHPFSFALRQRIKVPAHFPYYKEKSYVCRRTAKPISDEKKGELLSMLKYFGSSANVPEVLKPFGTCIYLQSLLLTDIIGKASSKPTEMVAVAEAKRKRQR